MGSKRGIQELMEKSARGHWIWWSDSNFSFRKVLNYRPQEPLRYTGGRPTQLFSHFLHSFSKHLLLATVGLKVVWPTCTYGRKECPAFKNWVPARSIQAVMHACVSFVLRWQQPFMLRKSLKALMGMSSQTSTISWSRAWSRCLTAPKRKGFS